MNLKSKFELISGDIRSWITFFFLIRLVGITNAPLEIAHNWRQTFTLMVSRNFYSQGLDLFHPMIDFAGEKSGIVGSEFPVYNMLIFLFMELFGYDHWFGRLINLTVSSIGSFYFYKLIKSLSTKRVAFFSTLVFICSMWFSYSRKTMPDTFSTSLVLIGLYYAYSFLKNKNRRHLILFFTFTTISLLSKIPNVFYFSVLALIPFYSEIPMRRKLVFLVVSLLTVAISFSWYFLWIPHLESVYKTTIIFPRTFAQGLIELSEYKAKTLNNFYFRSMRSYLVIIPLILGTIWLIRKRSNGILVAIILLSLTFLAFVIKTGSVFPLHSYYTIPFIPVISFIAGLGLSSMNKKLALTVLSIVMIEGIVNQNHDFFIKEKELYRLRLESVIDQHISKEDLIIINGNQSTQTIYFSNRKGWTTDELHLQEVSYTDSLKNMGAKYIVIDKHKSKPDISYPLIYDDQDFSFYQLVP